MIINCNNNKQILELLKDKNFITFFRGSRLYKTNSKDSDYDFGIIVSNDLEIIDIETVENDKVDKRIHNCKRIDIYNNKGDVINYIDVQIVKESDFKDMIQEHTPFAIEAIYSKNNMRVGGYRSIFKLDKWKLRESFSSVANNSWAKAHKKMTVEEDLDMYCGVKSLFHSIRLQKFACQIASEKEEMDFSECNDLWNEMKLELESGKDWDYFNSKYKSIYNNAHSEMVKCCPKPEENFKKPSKRGRKKKTE